MASMIASIIRMYDMMYFTVPYKCLQSSWMRAGYWLLLILLFLLYFMICSLSLCLERMQSRQKSGLPGRRTASCITSRDYGLLRHVDVTGNAMSHGNSGSFCCMSWLNDKTLVYIFHPLLCFFCETSHKNISTLPNTVYHRNIQYHTP